MKSDASIVKEAPRPAIVITGASSGIGRALALLAAKDGEVVIVARSASALEVLAIEIRGSGGKAHVLALDLAATEATQKLTEFLSGSCLFCDVLVNNAGYGLIGGAVDMDAKNQLGIVDLNISALTSLSLAVLPDMVKRQRGGILNVASTASFLPGPNMAIYYASKAYVRSFSEALWEETRRSGVTITALCPGPVATGFFARAASGGRKPALFEMVPGLSADEVAQKGWLGFKKGQRLVIPGWTNVLMAYGLPFIPARLVLTMVRRFQKSRSQQN
jgi:uncharacterized protein